MAVLSISLSQPSPTSMAALLGPSSSSSSSSITSTSSSSRIGRQNICRSQSIPLMPYLTFRRQSITRSLRRRPQIVRMAPEEEKMTRRSPLDFPIEWERPKPGRRPDIFPQFSPMKTPLPPPLPADPPEEDEEEEEQKEEEDDPEKENPDKPENQWY
ncbi:unnamed protein product [Ilex paraguariensis]|uniref:Uncharacterized protein n=1 Tax=Ilex paraguariensis TaxID=185542 RepID=A0ABC8UX72_9AQUA